MHANRVSRYHLSGIPLIHGGKKWKSTGIQYPRQCSLKLLCLIYPAIFSLSFNRILRNFIGFDSLITNDVGAIAPQLPHQGIGAIMLVATARAFCQII